MTDKSMMMHVAAEVVVISGVAIYFQRTLNEMKLENDKIRQELKEQKEFNGKLVSQVNNIYHILQKLTHSGGEEPVIRSGSSYRASYKKYVAPGKTSYHHRGTSLIEGGEVIEEIEATPSSSDLPTTVEEEISTAAKPSEEELKEDLKEELGDLAVDEKTSHSPSAVVSDSTNGVNRLVRQPSLTSGSATLISASDIKALTSSTKKKKKG